MMQSWLRQLQRLASDKRKASAAVALLAVAVLMWGRLLIKNPPRVAVADPQAQAVVQPAPTAGGATARPVTRPPLRLELPQGVGRDLFALAAEHFPPARTAELSVTPAKSPADAVDNNQRIEDVHNAAARLTLQSTILGSRPRALINGQLVEVGAKVAGFTVLSVEARRVTLEMDGIQVTLEM